MISTASKSTGPSDGRSNQKAMEPVASRVVPKPVPRSQVEHARQYQMEQLRTRYSPVERTLDDGSICLSFSMRPSDPDFPFELAKLECELNVPLQYPWQPPRLLVKNKDMPRGFAINIERGWDKLVAEKRDGATLLSLTYALDRRLESLLSERGAETVKLTMFKDTRHISSQESTVHQPAKATATAPVEVNVYVSEESFTREQIAQAKARRSQEIRQLEARMGNMALYRKDSDGVVYMLPVDPKRRRELPVGLQALASVQLVIPVLYPLQPPRVLFNDVESRDAEAVEDLFTKKCLEQQHMTLMSHLNYLTQNMHTLARLAQKEASGPSTPHSDTHAKKAEHTSQADDSRQHVHVIPRPPEWTLTQDSDDESDFSGDDGDDSHGDHGEDDDDDDEGGVRLEKQDSFAAPKQTAERGIAMSFPAIELYGIELLQVAILSLGVKCERCKTLNEIEGLRDTVEKRCSCKKCAANFAVRFRQEFVHQNSTRAGFIDAAGCTVSDVLPSTFVPTCAKCSTPCPGLVSVRGETTTNVCRECHGRFTFKIVDVKFLFYGLGSMALLPPGSSGPRRRQDDKLGLRAGEELPARGTCRHYKRSYRWFRFSCCSRVHACDVCHDEAEDHVHEWATRMVCGWCSREQRYAVDSCAFCGRSVIGKRGTGYWEGGKGTRNRVLMRKNDSRKYKRVGAGAAKKAKET